MNKLSTLAAGVLLLAGTPAFAAAVISEFMADNRRSTIDDDDDRSDWIEIYNPTGTPANLKGWALTDDPAHKLKWAFPAVTLPARGYLVVFASGKNRVNLNAPLHTDFKLRKESGYLALLDAGSRAVTAFSPGYPAQHEDISFGKGNTKRDSLVLLGQRAAARAFVPVNRSVDSTWKKTNFDDSGWKSGKTGVGYDYGGRIGLNVAEMRNNNETVYIRIPFNVADVAIIDELVLSLQYEDGFAAFINGKKVASDNTPATLNWNSGAPQNRPDSIATSPVEFPIPDARNVLVQGRNVLAIHGLNNKITSSDLLIVPELIGYKKTEVIESFGYMFVPTPRAKNDETVPVIEAAVTFRQPSQSFQTSIRVELERPEAANPKANIHYTLDGTIPSGSSPVYSGPLTLRETAPVKARLVHPQGGMGPVGSEMYIEIQRSLANTSSNLPLILLENYGDGRPPSGDYQMASMAIIEPENGRSRFMNGFAATSQVGIKVRGSSTGGRSKASLSLEVQDEFGEDKNLPLLGMPSESDWVLWGPYNFDRSLMHNPFIFELSRQIGRYAPRTRFVELYLNTGGGALSSADYYGVYALMEKISRDADRVDVDRLFEEHKQEPDVSGGYIFKIDRSDPGDSGFGAAGQSIKYVYPKEVDIERPGRDAQQQYVRRFFNEMGTALNASYYRDPVRGYAKYIDVDAAIDHHLLNVVAFNVDALRLSGYMYKPRGGKLTFGPIWDFDRALGSTDGRDNNPRTWRSTSGDRGTDFFNYPWWNRMFRDIDFFQKYIDRFQSLRQAEFSTANINAIIDGMANELKEAQKRDLAKWNQRPRSQYGGTYQGEVNHMKTWLAQRITFMEKQFVDPPESGQPAGYIQPGTRVSPKSREGGKIYYTLDGTDPRRAGGSVAPKAILYTGTSLQINESTLLTARVYKTSHRGLTGSNNPPLSSKWSGPLRHFYSVAPSPGEGDLLVSELNYHPADPSPDELAVDPSFRASDFEFLELLNNSDQPLTLTGLTVADEVRFAFPTGMDTILDPGQRLLLVRNALAFAARYGTRLDIGGVYTGKLNNGGGRLAIMAPGGSPVFELTYSDDWHPTTDGQGFSLVAKRVVPPGAESAADDWRPSWETHGSPGRPDEQVRTQFTEIRLSAEGVVLLFPVPAGRGAVVQYTDALGQAEWQALKTIQAANKAQAIQVIDSAWPSRGNRFYRLLLKPRE
ncbi:MAG: CotH kinase family protein [Verrucomicrobiota bacterium]|nr:CotH kinase family protein [Verrucomicrobiota bacterium]